MFYLWYNQKPNLLKGGVNLYTANIKLYASSFSVPTKITDEMLKFSSGEQLKVVLCILRNPESNAEEIASKTGLSVDAVLECVEYWTDAGVIIAENANTTASENSLISEKENAQMTEKVNAPKIIPLFRPSQEEIDSALLKSRSLTNLFNEAQQIFGKTLGYTMQCVIYNVVFYYGLSQDVANLLLTFANYVGATSQQDILKIAKSWSENGITTVELANDYIQEATKARKLFAELSVLTDNADTQPTFVQYDYLTKWIKWGFAADAVAKAHEIMKNEKGTGTLNFRNFQYMDKILKKWNDAGAHTLKEIESAPEKAQTKNKPKQPKETSFDIEKAKEKSRDRTRDIGNMKNKKRKRRA